LPTTGDRAVYPYSPNCPESQNGGGKDAMGRRRNRAR
jgi:hypothetical protein